MGGNPGQANYTSSNSYLESLSWWSRQQCPHYPAKSLLWGAVGDIGMRLKAFGSADLLSSGDGDIKLFGLQDAALILSLLIQDLSIEQIAV